MPKVKPEYFDKKKEAIIDAAWNVCQSKPLYQITMKDIIRESQISQGGIYRYYKNIDEILVELINRSCANKDYIKIIDDIISADNSAADIVNNLFLFLADYISDNAATLGKFQFQLTQLIAFQPERINRITFQNKHANCTQYFTKQLFRIIKDGVFSGEFHPVIPSDDILCFISTSIDGVVLDGVLHICYGLPENEYGFHIHRIMQTVSMSVLNLLFPKGIEEIDHQIIKKLGDSNHEK